jgi:hypothetical protein
MIARRLSSAVVLLALGSLSGCASWCARNYPCQAPAAYAPAAPCCCPAPAVAAPVCQPAGYAPTWQQPTGAPCTCR